MKQGINALLAVEIGMDLDEVEKIEFVIRQKDTELNYLYPSERAWRKPGEDIVFLLFTPQESFMFASNVPAEMDTRISLTASPYNPETPVVRFDVRRTLFEEVEADADA